MISTAILLFASTIPSTTVLVEADSTSLDGMFWENGHGRAYLHIVLGLGQTQQNVLSGDRILEASRSLKGDLTLRLLDPNGQLLHSASLGNAPADRTFRLALCGGAVVEFSSPAITSQPSCSAL